MAALAKPWWLEANGPTTQWRRWLYRICAKRWMLGTHGLIFNAAIGLFCSFSINSRSFLDHQLAAGCKVERGCGPFGDSNRRLLAISIADRDYDHSENQGKCGCARRSDQGPATNRRQVLLLALG